MYLFRQLYEPPDAKPNDKGDDGRHLINNNDNKNKPFKFLYRFKQLKKSNIVDLALVVQLVNSLIKSSG